MSTKERLIGIIHRAICESSPDECAEEYGDCHKAADAILAAGVILGAAS